jgi:hypothetical protein
MIKLFKIIFSGRIWTFDLQFMSRVLYHCATTSKDQNKCVSAHQCGASYGALDYETVLSFTDK